MSAGRLMAQEQLMDIATFGLVEDALQPTELLLRLGGESSRMEHYHFIRAITDIAAIHAIFTEGHMKTM